MDDILIWICNLFSFKLIAAKRQSPLFNCMTGFSAKQWNDAKNHYSIVIKIGIDVAELATMREGS